MKTYLQLPQSREQAHRAQYKPNQSQERGRK